MRQSAETPVVVVRLGEQRMALAAVSVVEILPAMEFAALPDAPPVVSGVVNLRGRPVPVLSLRARLSLPDVECHPDHHLLVCAVGEREVALWVDQAEAVTSLDPALVVAAEDVVASRHLEGIAVLPDGVMFVFDLQSFLDADEALQLDAALAVITQPVGS